MRRARFLAPIVTVALLAAAVAPTAIARSPGRFERINVKGLTPKVMPMGSRQNEQVDVIVGMIGKPLTGHIAEATAAGKNLTKAERAAILKDAKAAQAPTVDAAKAMGAKVRYTYQASYSGFSVRVARKELARLRALPGVTSVTPVNKVTLDHERSVPFIGAPSVWQDLGKTGLGVKVGIIDSGIDYYHANLGGSGNPADFAADNGLTIGTSAFPNAKVAGGYDFVGDAYDADTPVPDDDPLDCYGHGSHVAGTAAGFGVLANGSTYSGPYNASTIGSNAWTVGPGVAPQATLYAYRVFGCDGSANDDVIVAAIDRSVVDGMDVINMSLGSSFGTNDSADSVAANNAAAAGVTVVISAGNAGSSGYMVGSPGTATRAITVAAMDGGFATIPTATIDISGVGPLANNNSSSLLPVTGAAVTVLMDGPNIGLGCSLSDYAGTAGKIVVTQRGTCDRVDRAKFGQAAGAAAVIFVNDNAGFPPFEGPIPGVTIPFLGADGAASVQTALIGANGTSHTITAGAPIVSPSYKHLASFTSAGPRTGDSAAKPDITAPGVSVVSTAVGTGTDGATNSGTSMASPHVAGVAALVVQAHPSWTPAQIKAAIMNTATVDTSVLASSADAEVRLAGAGAVQPRKAVDTKLLATTGVGTSSLSFNAPAMAGPYKASRQITFWNSGASAVTLNLSNAFQDTAGVTVGFSFSKSSVKVPAGGSASVTVELSLKKSAVAALPDAEVSTTGEIVTIQGAVTATPTTAGAGLYALRIPWLLAPRGTSNIEPISPAGSTLDFDHASSKNLKLKNSGIHNGNADFYAWGNSSPYAGLGGGDLRADGVQALPGDFLGGASDDRSIFFAINTYRQWSNPSSYEFDVAIDKDFDDVPDAWVVGVDLGLVITGDPDGRYGSFIFSGDFSTVIDAWYADAPMNSSTLLLPALALADLGLSSSSPRFQYWVASYDITSDVSDGDTTWAKFNAYAQPVSTGDFVTLVPGATATQALVIDRASLATSPQKGWMIFNMDDPSGARQADLVKLKFKR